MQTMKTAIVTGAYGAIGKAICSGIVKTNEYKVIMVGRDPILLNLSVAEVRRRTGNAHAIEGLLDLSRKENIYAFAATITEPLHVLVNNAATAPRRRLETLDGIEMQWAVNVLAYFHLIKAFMPHLVQAQGARVVNVASYWAGGLNLNDPEFKKRRYDNDSAYKQSKQANRMMSKAFADFFERSNITVNACHPGDVNSKLSNDLGFGGHESAEQGADTPVWLATAREAEGITAAYFENRTKQYCAFMSDKLGVEHLFKLLNES